MKIKKIELYKYKRFSLNQIEKLVYTPIRNNQLILGRNMSGKSSLLKELSPLAANLKKDYYEGGYKYIEVEHNQDTYICSSGYKHESKHSFIHNGIELNSGGTMKVQNMLVQEHFKLTNDIMKLLLNIDKFSIMSPNERKIWINMMTKIDYNYSIGVFNKLKSRYRDLNGAIKVLTDRIAEFETSVLKEEEVTKLNQDLVVMEEYLDYIKSLITHIPNTKHINIEEIKSVYTSLTDLLKQTDLRSVIKLEKELTSKQERYKYNTTRLQELYKQLDSLDKLKKYGKPEDIKKKLEEQQNELNTIYNNSNFKIIKDAIDKNNYTEINRYYKMFTEIYPIIIDALNRLHNFEDYRLYTGKKIDEVIAERNNIVTKFKLIERNITLREEELKHMEKLKDPSHLVECNQCGNKWYNGYDSKLVEKYTQELVKLKEGLEKVRTKCQEYEKLEFNIESKEKVLEIIKYNCIRYLELKTILNYIFQEADLHTSPITKIISTFDNVNISLQYSSKIPSILRNIEELERHLKITQELKEVTDIDKLTNESIDLQEDIKMLKDNIKYISQELNKKQKIDTLSNKLQNILDNATTNYNNEINTIRNEYLNKFIVYIKEEMFKIQQLIKDDNNRVETIKKDSKSIENYSKINKVLKLALKELSPSEGLIAKSISEFIKLFVNEINNIINNIWTYELEVIPCDITEESDLDYNFKVRIDNGEVVDDISKLSSSGKEIVDLAFRIVFCRYMGLDVPLYLDEFGATFDKSHRTIAYNVIDKILSSDFDQLFLVCHYESLYGTFNECDIVVIDSNNIGLDSVKNYNSVLQIN